MKEMGRNTDMGGRGAGPKGSPTLRGGLDVTLDLPN